MEEVWVTIKELVKMYKVKEPTWRLWCRQGLPHLKCGRLVRFNPRHVQKWLEQKQRKVTNSDKHAA